MKETNKNLERNAEILVQGRNRAFVSRVAWFEVERTFRLYYEQLIKNQSLCSEFGNFYLSRNIDEEPLNKEYLNFSKICNHIQIHAGTRFLDVADSRDVAGRKTVDWLTEKGAALWFSQWANGFVIVFISPYKSEAMSSNEQNFILARYDSAVNISSRKIEKHIDTYLKYCRATSVHGFDSYNSYLFRIYLKFQDFRYRKEMGTSALRLLNIPVILSILATLYAGGKLFN